MSNHSVPTATSRDTQVITSLMAFATPKAPLFVGTCVRHRVERFHDLCIHLEHLELEAPPLVWEGLVLECSNPKGHMACECSADGGFTEI